MSKIVQLAESLPTDVTYATARRVATTLIETHPDESLTEIIHAFAKSSYKSVVSVAVCMGTVSRLPTAASTQRLLLIICNSVILPVLGDGTHPHPQEIEILLDFSHCVVQKGNKECALNIVRRAIEPPCTTTDIRLACQLASVTRHSSEMTLLLSETVLEAALAMLTVDNADLSRHTMAAVGKNLLPVAVEAAQRRGTLDEALKKVKTTAEYLWQHDKKQVSLSLVIQFLEDMVLQNFDLMNDHAFLALLKVCLLDSSALLRKRALYILKAITKPNVSAPWDVFIKLYDVLEEDSYHLVAAVWDNTLCAVGPISFPWMEIIWKKGMGHMNPQVQRLIVLHFLKRYCSPTLGMPIPLPFIADDLLPALSVSHMARGEFKEETDRLAVDFMVQLYKSYDTSEERVAFVMMLVGVLTKRAVPRLLVLRCTDMIAAVVQEAASQQMPLQDEKNVLELSERVCQACVAQVSLGTSILGVEVDATLIRLAQVYIPSETVQGLVSIGHILSQLPLVMLHPGGYLEASVKGWGLCLGAVTIRRLVDDVALSPTAKQADQEGLARLFLMAEASVEDLESVFGKKLETCEYYSSPQGVSLLKCLLNCATPENQFNQDGCTAWSALHEVLHCHATRMEQELLEMGSKALQELLVKQGRSEDIAVIDVFKCISSLSRFMRTAHQKADLAVDMSKNILTRLTLPLATIMVKHTVPALQQPVTALRETVELAALEMEIASWLCFGCSNSSKGSVSYSHDADEILSAVLSLLEQINLRLKEVQWTTERRGSLTKPRFINLVSWHAVLRSLELQTSNPTDESKIRLHARALAISIASLQQLRDESLPWAFRCIKILLPVYVTSPVVVSDSVGLIAGGPKDVSPSGVLSWAYTTAWKAVKPVLRRRGSLAVTLTSAILPSILFAAALDGQQPYRDLFRSFHTKDGPIHSFIAEIVVASERSMRLLSVNSLHLIGIWAMTPALAVEYCDVIVMLALSGIDDDSANMAYQIEEPLNAEAIKDKAALMHAIDPELNAAMLHAEAGPRVGVISLLHMFAVKAGGGAAMENESHCSPEKSFCATVWNKLLHLVLTDTDLSAKRYSYGTRTHRKKVRAWQALCALSPSVCDPDVLPALVSCVESSDASNVKQYMERTAVQILVTLKAANKHKEPFENIFWKRLATLNTTMSATDGTGSIIAMTVQFVLLSLKADPLEWRPALENLVPLLLPYTGSFVHNTRSFSQLILLRICKLHPWLLEPHGVKNEALISMINFFSQNKDVQRLQNAISGAVDIFEMDIEYLTSPRGIFCVPEEAPSTSLGSCSPLFESVPRGLVEAIAIFLQEERKKTRDYGMTKNDALQAQLWQGRSIGGGELDEEACPPSQGTSFTQRKITPCDRILSPEDLWPAALGISGLKGHPSLIHGACAGLDDVEYDDDGCNGRGGEILHDTRQDLIVVASLLDRPPNVGGLARTCEIFKASEFIVGDMSICKHPAFISLSVSSERWQPTSEVTPAALVPYLRNKSSQGYALIGLEQTTESTPLQQFQFPRKVVLVLGKEREGIPPDVLSVLDETVEIPQLGVTRSLNVHVSGAICIYEFTRQGLAA